MRLLVLIVLFAATLGIFEAMALRADGERMLARLVYALSTAAYLGVAVWWYSRKPQEGRR